MWFARMRGPDAPAHREAFARWHGDPDNAVAYACLVRIWDQAKFLASTPTGRDRDLGRAGAYRGAGRAAMRAGLLAAAGLCLALAFSLEFLQPTGMRGLQQPRVTSGAVAARTLSLPDGSQVTLDRTSQVRLAFTGTERRLRLTAGRARFDVRHDGRRPFIVDAGEASVIARGTLFDVALAQRGLQVTLIRGEVKVRAQTAGGAATRRLTAGQRIEFLGGALSSPLPVNPEETLWPSDMIAFERTPIDRAVAVFNRTSSRIIVLRVPEAAELVVTGVFRRGDPAGFAAGLAATFDLELRTNPDGSLALVERPGARAAKIS